MADGFVQVAADGSGKSVDNAAITVPAGTVVTGSDGTKTTLSADATYYRQRVVIGDPSAQGGGVTVRGEVDRGALSIDSEVVAQLQSINDTLNEFRIYLTMFAER
jgi:GTPase involved in cell partitioning and DNA repair